MLLIDSPSYQSRRAVLKLYQYNQLLRHWQLLSHTQAAIGKNGMTEEKQEGDMRTPIGIFPMGTGFGTQQAPTPSQWPFRSVRQNDFWVDDTESPDYNQWVSYSGDPYERWKSFERLAIASYAYAAVIRYNESPIIAGKGSAIFFHIWGGPDSYSAGCVTVAIEEVVKVLRWMIPEQHPHIAIGTPLELRKLVPFYN